LASKSSAIWGIPVKTSPHSTSPTNKRPPDVHRSVKKFNVVNALIRRHGYRNYLEICTPLTGMTFHRVDKTHLHRSHRLMYRCPPDFSDGNGITFRSNSEKTEGLSPQASYDIMFIDSWHTYECSMRDLREGFSKLSPGGALVMHDCFPANREQTSVAPPVPWGRWNGLTYCAYFDFILSEPGLTAYMVETDCGCAVIKKTGSLRFADRQNNEVARQWRLHRSKRGFDVFDFFNAHRNELANVISLGDFLALEGIDRHVHRSSPAHLFETMIAEVRHNVATRPHRRLVHRLEREGWLA